MLWAMAVLLIILWVLGLGSSFAMGSFIHIFYAAAVFLLVVSVGQEVAISRKSRPVWRLRAPKPGGSRIPIENESDAVRFQDKHCAEIAVIPFR